ncbi:MAG TPA: IclR family transcriptional regulator [Syntrophorhabdaceae bacterium]|nr:IclR family transcriptional regulator [Syntrophorhabdaceae bacterium]
MEAPHHTKKKKDTYTSSVPAVDDASRILIALAQNQTFRMSLTDISKKTNINKSKVYSILRTLQKYGFIDKHLKDKTYSLGPGLISLSRKILNNMDYREVVAPFLERLARETKSTALFVIINDGNAFVVAKHEGDMNIGVTIGIGHRFSATAGAHGKAIVAFLSHDERANILKGERLFFHGDASRLDRERLEIELNECREKGFAYDIGELNPGINAVAAPVFNAHEQVAGSLLVIGTFRETQIATFGAMASENAKKLSQALGADTVKIYSNDNKRKKALSERL